MSKQASLLPNTVAEIATEFVNQYSLSTTGKGVGKVDSDSDIVVGPDKKKRSRQNSDVSEGTKYSKVSSDQTHETETGTTLSTHEVPGRPGVQRDFFGFTYSDVPKGKKSEEEE